MRELKELLLYQDEFESLRLADFLQYSQEIAAEEMHISRAAFGRILESARRKIADAILKGEAVKINEN